MTTMQRMQTKTLLHILVDPHQSLGRRGAACRVLYWRCSFDFRHTNESSFQSLSEAFCHHGGMSVLCSLALSHENVVDVAFELPWDALSYDRIEPVSSSERTVTLRRLSIEVLSEMSNYLIYRRHFGAVYGGLSSLMGLTQRLLLSVRDNDLVGRSDNQNDSVLFMLERCLNLVANLAFDGELAVMASNRHQFSIAPGEPKGPQMEWEMTPKSYADATRSVSCFVLDRLTPFLASALPKLQCQATLRNAVRMLCNHIGFANRRILYRMALADIAEALEQSTLTAAATHNNGDQDFLAGMEQDGVGNLLTMANTTLRVLRMNFHALWRLHAHQE